jgi:subtilisin family serine protease
MHVSLQAQIVLGEVGVGSLDLVKLAPLMRLTEGRPEVAIGIIDGPVAIDQPDLVVQNVREVAGSGKGCLRNNSSACMHGTLVAGILAGRRRSAAPAICPGCTFLIRPIFREPFSANDAPAKAEPEELALAITDTVDAGARVINLSVGLPNPSARGVAELQRALDYAAKRGAICVVAAGNQGSVGGSALTRHPWVIPVAGCDDVGNVTKDSNLGNVIGRRGLRAPGVNVTSLGADGRPALFGGTSAATPFVAGTVALLASLFPMAPATLLQFAIARGAGAPRKTVVPPLLDAWAAYRSVAAAYQIKAVS